MKTSYRIVTIALLIAFVLSLSIVPQSGKAVFSNTESLCMIDSWPMFQKDLANSGRASENALPFTNEPEILWKYELDREKEGCSVLAVPIVVDNRVFFGGYNSFAKFSDECAFFCFDAENGDKIWQRKISYGKEKGDASIFYPKGLVDNPIIYNKVILFDSIDTSNDCPGWTDNYCISIENGETGSRYFPQRIYRKYKYSFYLRHKYRDHCKYLEEILKCPLCWVEHNNNSQCCQTGNKMILIRDEGQIECYDFDSETEAPDSCINNEEMKPIWTRRISYGDKVFYSSPTVYEDTVYVGLMDTNLMGFDVCTGKKVFETRTREKCNCVNCPVVFNNNIYFNTRDYRTICYDIEKKRIKWDVQNEFINESPIVYADGRVVYVNNNILECRDAETGTLIWDIELFGSCLSAPSICNGKIYVGASNGVFYCIGEKPESIKIESCNEVIEIGQEFVLEANGYNGRNRTRVHYSLKAEPEGIVSITGNKVVGLKEGTVEITARCGLVEDTCKVVVVKPQTVTSIEINPVSKIISLGESYTFLATVYDQDREAMKADVVWSVSDETLASVDSEGTVTGIKAGQTDVIASVGDVSATAILIVKDSQKVESIELRPDDAILDVGETVQFSAKALNWREEIIENADIEWSVDPINAGEIDIEGLFTASKAGVCIVTASSNGVESSVNVVVNKPLEPANISIKTHHLDFGTIPEGETHKKGLELTNTGDVEGVVSIESSHGWLSVGENSFTISPSETKTIDVAINTALAGDDDQLSGEFTISWGEDESLTVSVSAVIKPSCSIGIIPENLFFGKIPRGKEMTLPFVISSDGGKIKGRIEASHPWITVTPTTFDMTEGEVEGFVSIKASALPAGENFEGKITVIQENSSCENTSAKVIVKTDRDIQLKLTIGESKALLNDSTIELDVPPQIIDGRTLVPVRFISESFGCTVGWEAETGKITIVRGDFTITLYKDKNNALINGQEYQLDVPATIVSGRTLVPVRFISESFGALVGWEAETKTITVDWNPF